MIHVIREMLLSGSIGIIGGADGPTAIFITPGKGWYIAPLIIIAAIALMIWLIRRRKKK